MACQRHLPVACHDGSKTERARREGGGGGGSGTRNPRYGTEGAIPMSDTMGYGGDMRIKKYPGILI
jgi:hypothetical protein